MSQLQCELIFVSDEIYNGLVTNISYSSLGLNSLRDNGVCVHLLADIDNNNIQIWQQCTAG
jgi:hypothetical protein